MDADKDAVGLPRVHVNESKYTLPLRDRPTSVLEHISTTRMHTATWQFIPLINDPLGKRIIYDQRYSQPEQSQPLGDDTDGSDPKKDHPRREIYKWLRLQFGTSVSADIFAKRLDDCVHNLSGIVCIADDLMIYGVGRTDDEVTRDHYIKLEKLLHTCLNASKMRLRQKSVTFLGHVINQERRQPHPAKIEAIEEMPSPTDVYIVSMGLSTIWQNSCLGCLTSWNQYVN